MACCPPGSEPGLAPSHEDAGNVVDVEGVSCYVVGSGSSTVIIGPDVWGWNGGRVRQVADSLAATGVRVVIPKLLDPFEGGTDGDALPPDFDLAARIGEFVPWVKQVSPWEVIRAKMEKVLNYVKDAQKLAYLGFCYGGWLAFKCATLEPKPVAIAIPHPSCHLENFVFGEDIPAMVAGVACPVLFLPAGNDPPTYAPGGEIFDLLKSKFPDTTSQAFPEVNHGWTLRGDLTNETVARDAKEALRLAFEFIQKYLA
eukprot:TRINITY_DN210_c0_g1_i2.p1 TRINITY_DN210_c0_g1~~TRINITY_DN210_c0_g1_i2.p1  ORF type:complete len:256 (+),score=26.97 TRINITY_DN210_c0_g1_i2:53-820(+)